MCVYVPEREGKRERETERERERETEREIHGKDLFSMCTSGDIVGLNLQHRVRIEAT